MIDLPIIHDGEDKTSPLKNRIRTTYRHVRKWAKRTETDCFRIYDREIRDYPLAIDFYAGRYCVHYFSRDRENLEPPKELADEATNALKSLFGASEDMIYWRTRIKRAKTEQYEKAGSSKEFFIVQEYGVKFYVNLVDHLDTGLFLDHRETRHYIASIAKDKRLLNLFAYTGSFSVQAAAAGSALTKSVDMSNTYCGWARENFILNGLREKQNEIIRDDCLKFLDSEIQSKLKYDIIIVDPPTLSRSKKMDQMFDIQEDYIPLLNKALRLLAHGGVLFFSTNSRSFKFDASQFSSVLDVTAKTLPIDFHDAKIHRCWRISN